jgi:hypothetical protein
MYDPTESWTHQCRPVRHLYWIHYWHPIHQIIIIRTFLDYTALKNEIVSRMPRALFLVAFGSRPTVVPPLVSSGGKKEPRQYWANVGYQSSSFATVKACTRGIQAVMTDVVAGICTGQIDAEIGDEQRARSNQWTMQFFSWTPIWVYFVSLFFSLLLLLSVNTHLW